MTNIIDQLEAEQLKEGIPDFSPGDQVRVQVKVKEGNRERLQAYEGVVIAKKNRGLNSSFTVRKVASGVDEDRRQDLDIARVLELLRSDSLPVGRF